MPVAGPTASPIPRCMGSMRRWFAGRPVGRPLARYRDRLPARHNCSAGNRPRDPTLPLLAVQHNHQSDQHAVNDNLLRGGRLGACLQRDRDCGECREIILYLRGTGGDRGIEWGEGGNVLCHQCAFGQCGGVLLLPRGGWWDYRDGLMIGADRYAAVPDHRDQCCLDGGEYRGHVLDYASCVDTRGVSDYFNHAIYSADRGQHGCSYVASAVSMAVRMMGMPSSDPPTVSVVLLCTLANSLNVCDAAVSSCER